MTVHYGAQIQSRSTPYAGNILIAPAFAFEWSSLGAFEWKYFTLKLY